jgi:hypothetical protein
MLPQCFFRDRCDWHAHLLLFGENKQSDSFGGKLEAMSSVLGLLAVVALIYYMIRGLFSLKRWYVKWKNTQPIEEQGERVEHLKQQEKRYTWSKRVRKALREERRAAIETYNELLLDRAHADQLHMDEEEEENGEGEGATD